MSGESSSHNEEGALMCPELMSTTELKQILSKSGVCSNLLTSCSDHSTLVSLYKSYLLPQAQRTLRNNRRGRLLQQARRSADPLKGYVPSAPSSSHRVSNVSERLSSLQVTADRLKPPPGPVTDRPKIITLNTKRSPHATHQYQQHQRTESTNNVHHNDSTPDESSAVRSHRKLISLHGSSRFSLKRQQSMDEDSGSAHQTADVKKSGSIPTTSKHPKITWP